MINHRIIILETFNLLQPFADEGGTFVLHCYTGTVAWAEKFLELGGYLGITGIDWIKENKSDVFVVQDLVYSKSTLKPARWVLVVREDSSIKKPEDLEGNKVSTELVKFTKNYFAERSIGVEVEFSWGATEAKVVDGLVDAIVEVTETGSTIKAHNLRIVCDLMVTNPQLIANKQAWQDTWKRAKIEQVSLLLKGALQAGTMVGLKLNVPQSKLEKVIRSLPSLTSPTVASLYNSEWYSVETIISEPEARELIPQLQKNGAEGIIEYPLNKVI